MKDIKLYNLIFPIWLLLFFPPVVIFTLAGNFLIDSLVVVICFFVFKLAEKGYALKTFYRKSIVKVWLLGFLADIFGAAILFLMGILGEDFGVPQEMASAICFNPFENAGAAAAVFFAILVSGLLIFLFNYNISFKRCIEENSLRIKTALTLAIITMPCTFLVPTQWFYTEL